MQTKLTNILQTQFNKTIEDCTNASYLSTVFHGKQCCTINLDGRKS